MHTYNLAQIRQICQRRVAASRRSVKDDAQFSNWVVSHVEKNFASGRFQRLVSARSKQHPLSIGRYVDNVISHLRLENPRIRALECGDRDEWNRLREVLYRRACKMVRRFRPRGQIDEEALDFAQQACIIIFEKRYPCDVSFEAWATTILNRLIIAHYTRSPDALSQPLSADSIDQLQTSRDGRTNNRAELIPHPQSFLQFERIEDRIVLLNALNRLGSEDQRRVVIDTFFEGISDAQLAKKLRRSEQAIYNLRARALSRLKKILLEDKAKDLPLEMHKNR